VFRRGGRLLALFLVGPFLMLGGCRVDAVVTVAAEGPGGEVGVRFEADREALAVLGSPRVIAQDAQVADLRRAGWEVTEPRRTAAGGAVIRASKRFSRAAELGPVVEELAGSEGPLSRFRLDRDRSLTRVRYRLSGEIDLVRAEALTGFGNDPDLARRLEAAGVDAGRVAELLAQRAVEGFGVVVMVDLPGGDPIRFEGRPGARVDVEAASTEPDRARPLLLAAAAVLAAGALAVLSRRARPGD
jgi:hypothetical protein